jgi:hypothetical protein
MSKIKKIILLGFIALLLTGIFGYQYIMHAGQRNLATEKTDFSVSAKEIMNEFSSNTDLANKKYLEKAVAVSGIVTARDSIVITIDHSILCTLNSPNTATIKGEQIVIKGRVVGFDDFLGELRLDQSLVIKK